MTVEPLVSLDRSTLRERALVALRSAILSGQYRPGDHLGEVELAGHLGVSRGTVREALRHLQEDGLVTSGTRGMLRVNGLTPGEVTFASGSGSFTRRGIALTLDQVNAILANPGSFYLNIHTEANPGGVARGQLIRQQ